ncbi:lipoprotein NlpD [Thiohalorhabdus denitrificans]|uniref:Lipoprotein NlpD n=1 Tax=Thiohalorhabdus denitrificans TaxID=381306 RepID=A0A1G5HPE6_9GAMM|nr:lipoprotein NlpD [Thiohalorhabdus denitrificans]
MEGKPIRALVLAHGLLLILAGCGAPPIQAPSYHGPAPEHYQVRRGDTVYSIAQRFGLDHEAVLAWNDIQDPSRLRTGQRLRLRPPRDANVGDGGAETKDGPVASKAAVRGGGGEGDVANTSGSSSTAAPGNWRWPLEGPIIQGFDDDGRDRNKGIEIGAPAGTEVRAAADGEVVYSGDGLRGYGNLVIVRHAGGYITAYAYNQANEVAEGDEVAAGDVVARVGSTGSASESSLHFELRRRTDAIDPLRVLPAR